VIPSGGNPEEVFEVWQPVAENRNKINKTGMMRYLFIKISKFYWFG